MRGFFRKFHVLSCLYAVVGLLAACDMGSQVQNPQYYDPLDNPPAEHPYAIAQLFERPLIIGASVSASIYAPSPGELVIAQSGVAANIYKDAKDATYSSAHESFILQQVPTIRPTVVFAIDLFTNDFKTGEKLFNAGNVENVIKRLCDYSGQVYLGMIPELSGMEAAKFNQFVPSLQEKYKNLYLIPINRMIGPRIQNPVFKFPSSEVQVPVTLFISPNDRNAVPIHPNILGSAAIANVILDIIRQANGISASDLPNIFLGLTFR